MNNSAAVARVKVSADGHGVVSHAGVGILQEVAGLTGLSAQVTAALADTYRGPWTYAPGVYVDGALTAERGGFAFLYPPWGLIAAGVRNWRAVSGGLGRATRACGMHAADARRVAAR